IHYTADAGDNFPKRLAEHAERAQWFKLQVNSQKEAESATAYSLEEGLKQLHDLTQRVTGGAIGLKELFPLSLATYALFWVDRSVGAPMWLSILFFAFGSYMDLHQEEPHPELKKSLEALRAEIADLRRELHRRA